MNATRATWLPLGLLVLAAVVPLAGCNSGGVKDPVPAYTTGYYLLPDETPLHEISVPRGTTLNLTIGMTNIADVPIELRLAASNQNALDSLDPQLSAAWTTIQPGEKAWFSAVYYIPVDIPLGTYNVGITGKLREPVPDRAEQTPNLKLTIVDTAK
jgi:hypothetical protein